MGPMGYGPIITQTIVESTLASFYGWWIKHLKYSIEDPILPDVGLGHLITPKFLLESSPNLELISINYKWGAC